MRGRVPTLSKEGLVTDRVPVIMRAKDGTIIEVSEWKSHQAIEEAHKNPRVLAMWDKFFAVCDCVPLKTVPEAGDDVRRVRADPGIVALNLKWRGRVAI